MLWAGYTKWEEDPFSSICLKTAQSQYDGGGSDSTNEPLLKLRRFGQGDKTCIGCKLLYLESWNSEQQRVISVLEKRIYRAAFCKVYLYLSCSRPYHEERAHPVWSC